MNALAEKIHSIIGDYHCDNGSPLNPDRILHWVNQFEEADREFILNEFLHLLSQGIYVSKGDAKQLLWKNFEGIAKSLKYSDLRIFISETHFFSHQPKGKSQAVLLEILNELTNANLGTNLNAEPRGEIKNYVYIDDIIATGKTILSFLTTWLAEVDLQKMSNAQKIIDKKINCIVSVFCYHTWAKSNISWILKLNFSNDAFLKQPHFTGNYIIENSVWLPSSKLNLVYPVNYEAGALSAYFDSLPAERYADRAFRKPNMPLNEVFYSSPDNRLRFEKIILKKGIEILNLVKSKNVAHRPLGATYPSYKTLGTGTLFFTWRNISNTSPLVFWWDNPAHGWKGLFPLKDRGN